MMKKSFLRNLLIGLGIWSVFSSVFYAKDEETKFFVNGIERWDAEVVLERDTAYVPLRIVSEELGAQVTYNKKNKHIVVSKGDTLLEMNIGDSEALLNGEKFILSNKTLLHTTPDGQQITYIPLRNIFLIFDGVVDYNKTYKYINAYNKQHVAYTALQGLKSEDLSTYRCAQLALPRIGKDGMSVNGGRVVQYIFPLNIKTDYFFVRIDPSGDMDVTSIAYMEVENGVAICKWYKELRGDVYENKNPLDNAINLSLGTRGITKEVGEFPKLKETNFITFTKHSMMQPEPDHDCWENYKEVFEEMIEILTPQGGISISSDLIEKTFWSPYANKYKMKSSSGTHYYEYWANDTLLSQVNEEQVMVK